MNAASTSTANEPPDIQALRDFLAASRRLFVLTGAGCSTASGLPAYRDESGAWKHRQPMTLQRFFGDPLDRARYWARSLIGWRRFGGAQPNPAHVALARWEARQRTIGLLTQNVDGLHQAAGSRNVVDLHGRIDQVICLGCGQRSPRNALQRRLLQSNPSWATLDAGDAPDGDARLEVTDFDGFIVPACAACGGVLKPDVVFFGENVPRERVDAAMQWVDRCDALLVIGSSLTVWSGYRFAVAAANAGKPVAAINRGVTRANALLSIKVDADCVDTLVTLGDI